PARPLTTETDPLSLHDALPISRKERHQTMAHDEHKSDQPLASKTYLVSAGIVGLVAILGLAVVGIILWPESEEEAAQRAPRWRRSEEHTSELQSRFELVCRRVL